MREGFAIARDGTPLYYRVLGEGPPIILSDGIGCDGYVWKYLIEALRPHYTVIHWNYRGHGKTPMPQNPAKVAVVDLADDLATLLDHLEQKQAVLVGHSMGVQVCLETYRRYPDRVLGLALICGSYGTPLRTFRGKDTLESVLPVVKALVGHLPLGAYALMRRLLTSEIAFDVALRLEINGQL